MNVEHIIALSDRVAMAFARAQVTHTLAQHATSQGEYDHLSTHAAQCDRQVSDAHDALISALRAAPPATPEPFLPVRVEPSGHVEIHARDDGNRPVVVRMTGAEALSIGHHLIAYAAIGLDRTGIKVVTLLPPLPVTPPSAVTRPNATTATAPAYTAPPTASPTLTAPTTRADASPPNSDPASRPHPHRAARTQGDHYDHER